VSELVVRLYNASYLSFIFCWDFTPPVPTTDLPLFRPSYANHGEEAVVLVPHPAVGLATHQTGGSLSGKPFLSPIPQDSNIVLLLQYLYTGTASLVGPTVP